MYEETNGVIHIFVFAQCAMSTLMCQLPHSGEDEALEEGVESPSEDLNGRVVDAGDIGCNAHEDKYEADIPQHVGHGEESVRLETVRRNCIVNIFYSVLQWRKYLLRLYQGNSLFFILINSRTRIWRGSSHLGLSSRFFLFPPKEKYIDWYFKRAVWTP